VVGYNLHTKMVYLSGRKSPIQVITGPGVEQLRWDQCIKDYIMLQPFRDDFIAL